MAGRTFHLTTHRVVDDSLIGRDLAPPVRRLGAFGLDVGLLAVPTVLAAFFCAALALRAMDRQAYDALRALVSGQVRTEAASLDVMAALLPRLVEIGVDGLPLEAMWRDPNRRLAHDRGANTVVLRARGAAPEEEAASRESEGSHSS